MANMNNSDGDEDIIVLSVEGIEIEYDRRKLIQHSPYFDAMFNGSFTEKDKKYIELQDVKINGIKNVLNLLDKKIDFIEFENIYDALENACMLQFDFVKQHCIKKLEENINVENCLRTWQVAEQYDLHPLAEKAKCKALMEFNLVRNTNSINYLNVRELHSYLGNTLLHCDNEIDVFETGIRWWYEHYRKTCETESLEEKEKKIFETKHLLVILRCLDYTSMQKADIQNMLLICPDIDNNEYIKSVLKSLCALLNDEQVSDQSLEERTAVELFHNCRGRKLAYWPCIICRELNENFNKSKRPKFMNCKCVNNINTYYYDKQLRSMKKLIDLNTHNEDKCNSLLEGYHIIPYKENLLFFGGEYKYGTADWNKSIWCYRTFTDEWKLLTKLPKERRHFKSIIIEDKLYIIGGTGKYRIIQDNMLIYDIKNDIWETTSLNSPLIKLPDELYNLKCCSFQNRLFLISGNFANRFGFLYNAETTNWQRINILETNEVPKEIGDFIICSLDDNLFIKGSYLIQMKLSGAELTIVKCSQLSSELITPDELGCCQIGKHLYLFSHHTCKADLSNIYVLELFNLETENTQTLLQINDNVDISWNIHSGCFTFFHYSIAKQNKTVLDFNF